MRSLRTSTAPAVMAAAVTLMLISLFDTDADLSQALYRIGLALSILAATGWVLMRNTASEQQLEAMRRQGYGEGFHDALDVNAVVDTRLLPPRRVPVLGLASESPAHELAEQDRVASGADRAI